MKNVLVTGASGFVGRLLVDRLAASERFRPVALDLRPADNLPESIDFVGMDVRDEAVHDAIREHEIDAVVHLAAVVDPPPGMSREEQESIDVGGTENVLRACLETASSCRRVQRIVVTSSGAAYGYRPDHPRWITEDQPLRADRAFAYAWHKRRVEEILEHVRRDHPELEQVIFRVGTILGPGVHNAIIRLFDAPRLLGVRGGDDRFVFVAADDVAACLERAIEDGPTGIYNLAGDGALSMAELAGHMGKRHLRLPTGLVRVGLRIGRLLGLIRLGPEQVRFVQYRPVLSNEKLKRVFGHEPRWTSEEVFARYLESG